MDKFTVVGFYDRAGQFEDKTYDRASWKVEVAAGNTQQGYFDWVIGKLDAEAAHELSIERAKIEAINKKDLPLLLGQMIFPENQKYLEERIKNG